MFGRKKQSEAEAPPPTESADQSEGRARFTAFVRGQVQGVGFRWWAASQARRLGLSGHAKNLPDGRVEVMAQGPRANCEQLLALLQEQPTTTRRPGSVTGVTCHWLDPIADTGTFLDY